MIPDISELMVRMMIIMGLVTRKITGAQTIQVIGDIDDDGDNIVGDFKYGWILFMTKNHRSAIHLCSFGKIHVKHRKNCQVTMTVMHWDSQLSEMSTISQLLYKIAIWRWVRWCSEYPKRTNHTPSWTIWASIYRLQVIACVCMVQYGIGWSWDSWVALVLLKCSWVTGIALFLG